MPARVALTLRLDSWSNRGIRRNQILLAFAALLLAAGEADAGEIGIPCEPGRSSTSGFEPCSPCPVGTIAPSEGQSSCDPCPFGTYVNSTGQTRCFECGCDDHQVCTRDTCGAGTGLCEAPPVPGCELVTVGFRGNVTQVYPAETEHFSDGMLVDGWITYDPTAPDLYPLDPALGSYPSAVQQFVIGFGPHGVTRPDHGAPSGLITVVDGHPTLNDQFQVTSFDIGGPGPVLPDFYFTVNDPSESMLDSDALPLPAALTSPLYVRTGGLEQISEPGGVVVDTFFDDFTVLVPEPEANALGLIALAALHRARRHRTT
jgi:hypothetical protein